ncbi:hypothetical protein P3551_20975 [Vibrio parahaemolyticus]|nr:hypothetical protein [Vibrio parahaemolyticus]MDF4901755.1 hypothetical protein [Vibrio parahaemolyticus]HCM0701288.1 hypothetical protein [Vibrio parahaemolyticus]
MSEVTRKPRFQGHEPFNAVLRADWINAIKLSPDNFEAFLYRPVGEKSEDTDSGYQKETVIELDTNQDNLTYGEPDLVAVLDCPDEQENFFMMNDGQDNLGESVDPMMLRIGALDIPIGSVLEWDEETASGIRTVWWYVHKAVGYGAANVGVIYICIPMRDFNQEPPAEPEITPDEPIGASNEPEHATNEPDSGIIEL